MLRKGEIFLGKDHQKYVFLGYQTKNRVYCLGKSFSHNNEILVLDTKYILQELEEKDETIKTMPWLYEDLEEYKNSTLEDKLDTFFANLNQEYSQRKEETEEIFHFKKIKGLVRGQVSYQKEETFDVIGFIVESEIYKKNKKVKNCNGFISIYHSKCDLLAPMNFLEEENKMKFYNGENYVLVKEIIKSEKEILKYIIENHYSNYFMNAVPIKEKVL